MKNFVNVVLIVAVLTLMGPVAGLAQLTPPPNVMTLQPYLYSTAHDNDCSFVDDGEILTLHVYLYDPVNPSFGLLNEERPVTNIGGFECVLEFTEGAEIVGETFPPGAVNAGTPYSLEVFYGIPLPVLTNPVLLCAIDVFFGGDVSFELAIPETMPCYLLHNVQAYVKPPLAAQVLGKVSYTDADDSSYPLVGADCHGDEFDFKWTLQSADGVGNVEGSWDALKALYR